ARFWSGRAVAREHNHPTETHLQPILPSHIRPVAVGAHLDDAHTRQGIQGGLDISRTEARHAAAVRHLLGLDVVGVIGVRNMSVELCLCRSSDLGCSDLMWVVGVGEVSVKNLKVLADRVQIVLAAVSDGWHVRIPRHAAYASSNCNSISRRRGRDRGRTTRYAVM